MNIFDAPTFKLSDRKALVSRVHAALIADPNCRFDFKGPFRAPTADEFGNWEARQHFLKVSLAFPVDKPLEALGTEEQAGSPEGNLTHTPDQVVEA